MHWAIDRFEDGFAVLVYGCNTVYIKEDALPEAAHEGSMIEFHEDGPTLREDIEQEKLRRNQRRLRRLFRDAQESNEDI